MMSVMTEIQLDVGILRRLLDTLDTAAAFAHKLLTGAQEITHLLRLFVGHETASNQAVRHQVGQPTGIVDVGLAARHVLDHSLEFPTAK